MIAQTPSQNYPYKANILFYNNYSVFVGAIRMLYVCRKNLDCSRKRQVDRRPISMSALQLPQLPQTTASSWIPVSGPAVANLQDFDSSDNNEAPLRGTKEEQHLGQMKSNLGKKPYRKQIKTSRSSN